MAPDSLCEAGADSHQWGMPDEKVNKQHEKLNIRETYELHLMD